MNYSLDLRGEMLLEAYHANLPLLRRMKQVVDATLSQIISDNNIYVNAIETRIKEEASLIGKLERKGSKYRDITDITDLLGARVITFYSDEVDKISALVEKTFDVDWTHSVDKRKLIDLDRFGYMSLHYICRIPASLFADPALPQINQMPFEIQMRTALQHVWATISHDTGYKSRIEVPQEHLRNLNRIAGMLELADEQFSRIRMEITEYRRSVQHLVADGDFNNVPLNGDTWRSYLAIDPFEKLASRFASINQGEIYRDSLMPYLAILLKLDFRTLGDVERLIRDYSDDAYQLALHQFAGTGLDIFAFSITLQNLLCAMILRHGYGPAGLQRLFDKLGGTPENNRQRALSIYEQGKAVNIVAE